MGGAGAVFWCLLVICGGELSGDGAERCQVGWEPTLHRRLRPGRGWCLGFLFRGVFLGCRGCWQVWFLGRCW